MAGTVRSRPTEETDPGVVRFVRMENTEGGASKAYVVCTEHDPAVPGRFRCRAEWGAISGHMTEQVKATGDASRCERALGELVRKKQGRGYRVVADKRIAPGPSGSAGKAPASPAPVHPTTEPEALREVLALRKREARWAI